MAKTLAVADRVFLYRVVGRRSGNASPKLRKRPRPAWSELTPAQQQVLAPLQPEWEQLDTTRRRKWVTIADRYPDDEARPAAAAAEAHAGVGEAHAGGAARRPRALPDPDKQPPQKREEVKRLWEEYEQARAAPPPPAAPAENAASQRSKRGPLLRASTGAVLRHRPAWPQAHVPGVRNPAARSPAFPDGARLPVCGSSARDPAYRAVFQVFLTGVAAVYFTWQWTHGGQTLPMKTWRVRLVARERPARQQRGRRCCASWRPRCGLAAVGLTFVWALVDRDAPVPPRPDGADTASCERRLAALLIATSSTSARVRNKQRRRHRAATGAGQS